MAEERLIFYRPSEKVKKARESAYRDFDFMRRQRDKTYKQFNNSDGDRSLIQFLEDGDKRLNGYTLTRSDQEKESWQANYFDPITRNKLRAIVASIALTIPDLEYKAVNKEGIFSMKRAEVMKQLVRHSRIKGQNPQVDMFFEGWETAGSGTIIKYDGYLKAKRKVKLIQGIDEETGKVEFEEKEEIVEDRPIDTFVPLSELYIWDFFIFNIQDQSKLAWTQKYNKEMLEQEFGHLPNYKFVKDKQSVRKFTELSQTFFYQAWSERVENTDDFEVLRYYNKIEDRYEVWVNGVDLIIAPMLLGRKRKMFPFSKTILEPFEGVHFFYGKSLASILEGIQDVDNTLINSILDKLYRSLEPPMLVGLINKDILEVEDEFVNQDNRYYVPDVNQVKPMPFDKVNTGDIAMLERMARSADLASVDVSQQGVQGKGITAREVIIADERARQLKGAFYMFLEDLWVQKTRLRILNILTNYTQPKIEKIEGKEGFKEILNILTVPDVQLSDGTKGTLGIQIASSKEQKKKMREKGIEPMDMLSVPQIEAREDIMRNQGVNFKQIAITSDYLDDWEYDFAVVPASLINKDKIREQTEMDEKLQRIATFFPEYFAANKEAIFADVLEIYGDTIENYQPPPPLITAPISKESPLPEGSPLSEGALLLQQKDLT